MSWAKADSGRGLHEDVMSQTSRSAPPPGGHVMMAAGRQERHQERSPLHPLPPVLGFKAQDSHQHP